MCIRYGGVLTLCVCACKRESLHSAVAITRIMLLIRCSGGYQAQRQELKQQLLKDAHTKLRQVQTRLTTLSARKAHASPALLLRERQRNHIRSKRRKLENTPWTSPVSASAAAQRHALLHVVADAQQCTQNAFNLRHLVHGIPPAKRVVDEVCQELEQLQHRMEKYSSESSKGAFGNKAAFCGIDCFPSVADPECSMFSVVNSGDNQSDCGEAGALCYRSKRRSEYRARKSRLIRSEVPRR